MRSAQKLLEESIIYDRIFLAKFPGVNDEALHRTFS